MSGYMHKIYCETEAKWVFLENNDPTEITVCPNNAGHTVTAGSASMREFDNIYDRLPWDISPVVNGQMALLGFNIQTDTAYALSNASPLTISEPAYHSHIIIDASNVVGAPFNLTITGMSVDESTGVTTPTDTEVISITGNGFYQSTTSWIDAVVLSVPAGKTLTIDVFRNTYWDMGNRDFEVEGSRLEWTPSNATWSFRLQILKVNNDGSITTIDDITFANTDTPPRAAQGKPGKYKRGDYEIKCKGAQMEGIIVGIDQTNIRNFHLEVKIHD